ncbi:MAG: SDR family oxidoreductase [Myxococcales bacterium]|nr:SDR family oxidoreductase [Myxococcales bacterium]
MAQRQTALVTGASSGIGLELAKLLAKDGYDLVLVARSEDKLRALADELSSEHGVDARVEPADLGDPAAPGALQARLDAAGVQVDVLVNNAGFGTNGRFVDLPLDRELGMVQLNVTALTELTHRFAKGMVERGRGRVLNIASTAGFQPGPGMAVYYATKAYVISFSEAVAHELRGTGVTVTAHCPGATDTAFAHTAGNDKSLLFKSGAADATAVARSAYGAMQRGKVLAIHGVLNWLLAQSVRLSPRAIVRAIAARMNR